MRKIPILNTESRQLHPNAGLVLIGHMLFPNQPIDRGMYIDLPEHECSIACNSLDELDEETTYPPSTALKAIIKTRQARLKNAILAGVILQKKIQLHRNAGDTSTRKAIWLVGKETEKSKMKPGSAQNTRRSLKRYYSTYVDVAHLWAAWKMFSPEDREKIHGSGNFSNRNALFEFLGMASWFQNQITEIEGAYNAQADRNPWLVPDVFSVPQDALCVPALSAFDQIELEAYDSSEY